MIDPISKSPSWLSVRAAATELDVSEDVVRAWISMGALAASDCSASGGHKARWRISRQALETFLLIRQNRQPPAAQVRRRPRRDTGVIEFFK